MTKKGNDDWMKPFPGKCRWCGSAFGQTRITVPRAKTGDLQFCTYPCIKEWEQDAMLEALMEE
jgi:hypothetical protein